MAIKCVVVKKTGEILLSSGNEETAGKPVELTVEEQFAIELINRGAEVLEENPERFPKNRMASIDIWPDHIAVTITQYGKREEEHERLGSVFATPGKDEYWVFRG